MAKKKITGPVSSGVSLEASAQVSFLQQHGGACRWVPKQGGRGGGQHQGRGGHYQGLGRPGLHHSGSGQHVYQPRRYQGRGAPHPIGGRYHGRHGGSSVEQNVPPGPNRTAPELHQAPYVQDQPPVVPLPPSGPAGSGNNNNNLIDNKRKKKKVEEEQVNKRLIATSGKNEKEKKGFLASINVATTTLFTMSLAFLFASVGYPLTANAKLKLGDPWMQAIIGGYMIVVVASVILTCLASGLKGRGSIEGGAFHIFMWLLCFVWLFFSTVICISLRFEASMSDWIVWPLNAIIDIIILSFWGWHYYCDKPQILEEGVEKDSVGDDGSAPFDMV